MIKKIITLIAITIAVAVPVLVPATALAADTSLFSGSKDAVCGGAQASDNPVTCDATTSTTTLNDLIKTGLNLLSIVVAVIAVIMIMLGGFKFITSQGEGANTASARNTIIYAIIGLVVVVMAQLVVRLVLTKVTPKPAAPNTTVTTPPATP